jgi:hypothetical protein
MAAFRAFKRPAILPILGRLVMLMIIMGVAVGGSCCWYAHGIKWIFDPITGTYPLFDCPDFVVNRADSGFADGPMCRVTLANNGLTQQAVLDNEDCHMPPLNSEDYITCLVDSPCRSVCSPLDTSASFCPDSSLLSEPTPSDPGPDCDISLPYSDTFTIPCFYVNWTPYCDGGFRITPGAVLAMRSLFAGAAVMMGIWLFAEITLWSADRMLARDTAGGKLRQSVMLSDYKRQIRIQLERLWEDEAMYISPDPMYTEGSVIAASSSVSRRRSWIESRDPRKRFDSVQWKRKVETWKNLHAKKSNVFRSTFFARSVFLSGFFVTVLILAMYTIITVSPSQIPASADILSVLDGTVRILPLYTWMDCLIFLDILLDFGLFVIATASVSWPTSGVFASHMRERLGKVEEHLIRREASPLGDSLSDNSGDTRSIENASTISIESVMNQTLTLECCLMIACHESCLSEDKEKAFRNTLECALRVFPPDHIFVCDNGNSIAPVDTTQAVASGIHPDIHYLYIPEGNKTISFYWCNRYWIPYLESMGRVRKFLYAVIIDDDVPLPPDLHIPIARLRADPRIRAVHYPITAMSTDGGQSGILVKCQDIEYKLAAVHKYFQSVVARVISCHGAIALWERNALTEVLLEHDCVFNGEDMYMGISLLRKRDSSLIISCPQSIVPTFAPSSWRMLFRQRVKSWEVTSHKKTFTFLLELINPISWFHIKSVALKPYFMQELLSIILDWLRVFLLISLAFRDYTALALMTALFSLIMYVQVIVFQFVYLRRRKDLRVKVLGVIMFPLYRLSSLLFRVCALMHNILVYSHYRKGVRIQDREDEVKDMPPCPPHPQPDWFTVWNPSR